MLFIFAVGIEAGPHFSASFRDGLRYISLALVILGTAMGLTWLMVWCFDLGPGLAC